MSAQRVAGVTGGRDGLSIGWRGRFLHGTGFSLSYMPRQQCTDQLSETVWQLSQQATKVTQQLRNPGVNKTLVLTALLDKLALVKAA